MSLKKRLQQLRKSVKLSQEQMAQKMNISRRSYGLYELGKTAPSATNLKVIAQFFDVSIDWLLTGKHSTTLNLKPKKISEDIEKLFENPTSNDSKAFVVKVQDDFLAPEGIKEGYQCFCSFSVEPKIGDIVYIEEHGGAVSLKILKEQNKEWITLASYLPKNKNGTQETLVEKRKRVAIVRMATVIYVKRR